VVHFSVQGNHVHLVVEADDRRAMTQGMRALLIRVAKRLNDLMGTSGRVYADRFHERVLRTSREVRNVVRYVLRNHEHHYGATPEPDRFSSAVACDVVSAPGSWLLREGWARAP
jgi:REP element-mobilizing transposase RayT